jgi:hypothetical protein
MAADLTDELRLKIGKPDMIRPTLRTDDDRMRAFEWPQDDEPGRAGFAHFAEGDFLLACHGSILPLRSAQRPEVGHLGAGMQTFTLAALRLSDGAENKSGIGVYRPCITEQIVGVGNALIFLVPARTR